METIILTGMSGAGKTHAANTFEDYGCHCVDNMPAIMIGEFMNLYEKVPGVTNKVAFIIDVRGESEFDTLIKKLEDIKSQHDCKLIFLDCADEVIITRYKETRRSHPFTLLKNVPMREAIEEERRLLAAAKEKSDIVIDTSKLTVQQLRARLNAIFNTEKISKISINCMSFGFKYGVPSEADLVFDARAFPNPFYIESLREKTGLDEEVCEYVLSHENMREFIEKLKDLINFLLPLYINEGRSNLIVAVGCTGGKHRSVCISEILKKYLQEKNYNAFAVHRDIIKI